MPSLEISNNYKSDTPDKSLEPSESERKILEQIEQFQKENVWSAENKTEENQKPSP
jgi:hypothetical protein